MGRSIYQPDHSKKVYQPGVDGSVRLVLILLNKRREATYQFGPEAQCLER